MPCVTADRFSSSRRVEKEIAECAYCIDNVDGPNEMEALEPNIYRD